MNDLVRIADVDSSSEELDPLYLLEAVAENRYWDYVRINPHELTLIVEEEQGLVFKVVCRWNPLELHLALAFYFEAVVPRKKKCLIETALLLRKLNEKSSIGFFTMPSVPRGITEVYFRSDLLGPALSPRQLAEMLDLIFTSCAEAFPTFRMVFEGLNHQKAFEKGMFGVVTAGEG